jgi:hypothetical protein
MKGAKVKMISKKTLISRLDDLVDEVENDEREEFDIGEVEDLIKEARLFYPFISWFDRKKNSK